jgi:hypothetical protein
VGINILNLNVDGTAILIITVILIINMKTILLFLSSEFSVGSWYKYTLKQF